MVRCGASCNPGAPHHLQDARQNLGGRLTTAAANYGCSQFEGSNPLVKVAVTHTNRPGIQAGLAGNV